MKIGLRFTNLLKFITDHPDEVKVITAFLTTFCAVVLLALHRRAPGVTRWAKYLSYAFFILTGQYLLLFWADIIVDPALSQIFSIIGSSVNNLFFLAAARDLLGRQELIRHASLVYVSSKHCRGDFRP